MALPDVAYPLGLLRLADLDTVAEMQSSAQFHKSTQARHSMQRSRQATKPWVPAARAPQTALPTPQDSFVFATVLARHAAPPASSPKDSLLTCTPLRLSPYVPVSKKHVSRL